MCNEARHYDGGRLQWLVQVQEGDNVVIGSE